MANPDTSKPATELLNLDDITDRAILNIDGAPYELRHIAMLTPMERHRLQRLSRKSDELENKPELTSEEETELLAIPDQMCQIVLRAPVDVHRRLNDDQRQAVLQAFFTELPTPQRRENQTFQRRLSTGGNGSAGSAGSTVVAP